MSLLRMKELRALDPESLRRKISEIEDDLLRERGIAAMGGAPPSPGRMRALRTNVARALTVLHERARPERPASAPAPAAAPARPRRRPARATAPPRSAAGSTP